MIAFPAPSSSSQLRSNHRSALGLGLLALCLALGLLAVTSSVGAPAASSVGAPAAVGGETRSRNAYIMVGPGAIVFGEDSKKLEDPCNLAHQDWDKFVAKFGVTPEAACHGQAAQKGAPAVDTGDVHVGMDAIAVNGVSVGTSGVKAGGVSVTPDGGVDLGGGAGVAPSSPPPVGTEQPWGILLPAFVGGGGDLRGAIKAASAALGGGEDEEGAEGQDEEKPESWYVMVGPGFGAANHDKAE